MADSQPGIIFFHYPFSPWSQKITAYLAFRGIQYTECHQPVWPPRPDLYALGVKYRRIPVMSIGRDIYCDTVIMFEKLQEMFPDDHVSASNGYDRAMEKLLEKWTDVVVFKYAAAAIPTDMEIMKNKDFVKDRTELWGRDWQKNHQDKLRPDAIVALRNNFDFIEQMVLADGRKWVLGGDNPGLADIHAAWILQWLYFDIPGALPENLFSKETHPKTIAWLQRYRDAVASAKERAPKPKKVEGDEAVKTILSGGFGEPDLKVDSEDASGLKKGDEVEGWPADTGQKHRDRGSLVGLTPQQSVIEVKAQDGTTVRIHHPRWNFHIEAAPAHGRGTDHSHHHGLAAHGGDEGLGAEHIHERA